MGGVPIEKEIQLLNSGQLLRRGEFGPLSRSRRIQVASSCYDIGIPLHQASSIRKQLLIQKVTSGSWLLKDEEVIDCIVDKFCRKRSILKLAYEYDLPPVSILRCIIKQRVKEASPHIIRKYGGTHRLKQITMMVIHEQHQNYLSDILTSSWERRQLQIAKAHDSVGYQRDVTAGASWESQVFKFFDLHDIKYIKEKEMKQAGILTRCTPDCLFIDDVYINGEQVRWLELKSFYASGLDEVRKFTEKSIVRQVEKYERTFGEGHGAVILRNGFSKKISDMHKSTLFLDGGPLFIPKDLNLTFE